FSSVAANYVRRSRVSGAPAITDRRYRRLELQNRPAALRRDSLQASVGIHDYRIADGFEHRGIGEAVRVSLRLREVGAVLTAKALDRRHLLRLGNQGRDHFAGRRAVLVDERVRDHRVEAEIADYRGQRDVEFPGHQHRTKALGAVRLHYLFGARIKARTDDLLEKRPLQLLEPLLLHPPIFTVEDLVKKRARVEVEADHHRNAQQQLAALQQGARLRGVVARKKGVAHDDVARTQGAVEVVEGESGHKTAVSCQSSVVSWPARGSFPRGGASASAGSGPPTTDHGRPANKFCRFFLCRQVRNDSMTA